MSEAQNTTPKVDGRKNRKCPPLTMFKNRGVDKVGNRYRARIRVNGALWHLGYFENRTDAIKARDNAAVQAFGDRAALNWPDGTPKSAKSLINIDFDPNDDPAAKKKKKRKTRRSQVKRTRFVSSADHESQSASPSVYEQFQAWSNEML